MIIKNIYNKLSKVIKIAITALIFIGIMPLSANNKDEALKTLEGILEILKVELDSSKPKEAQKKFLQGFVSDKFDYDYMCTWSLGNYNRVITESELAEYLVVCKTYMVNFYGEAFTSYYAEYNFDARSAKEKGSDFIVSVDVSYKDGGLDDFDTTLNADWYMNFNTERGVFLLYDLNLNGISVLSVQRKSFMSEIKNKGGKPQAIIDFLKVKNAEI